MIRVVVTLYGVPKLITAEVSSSVLFTGKAKLCSGGKQIVTASHRRTPVKLSGSADE